MLRQAATWDADMPFVYILSCGDGSLYTGAARDLERRLAEHSAGKAAKYTRARLPVTLAWRHQVRTWPRALALEWRIKRLPRAQKLALVAGRPLESLVGPIPRKRKAG